MGERHWGGYAQLAKVKSEWLVPLPEGMTGAQAMMIGTAGLTAMLSVMALEEHGVKPNGRPIAVTGAGGGVGSVAVALLANLGYWVTAFTGREETRPYLQELGAREVLDRNLLLAPPAGPLETERWGGAIDTVGGEPLVALLRAMAYGTSVTACGLAAGPGMNATVLPFILRGVSLLGIDSVMCPQDRRLRAWSRLAQELPAGALERISTTVGLDEVPRLAQEILKGQVRGRVVVDLSR
jgi:acrylyl-CoA reductase (NADPH)